MSGAIDYAELLREAGRIVVRRALAQVAEEGLPGEHHFYLTFDTRHGGVEMSPGLRRRHPEAMTIILQHQFWELEVDEEAFAVTLRFDGRHQRLRVPFAALTAFVDPGAEFGLQFAPPGEATTQSAADAIPSAEPGRAAPAESTESGDDRQHDPEIGDNLLRFDRGETSTPPANKKGGGIDPPPFR